MTIRSLLYVSRSRVAMPGGAAVVNAIVQGAVAWNGANGVTGALLFTERHFAQLLEGPDEAITELLTRIAADTRHGDLRVVDNKQVEGRSFGSWSMAYSGPARYVDRFVAPLVEPMPGPAERIAVRQLVVLLLEFSAPQTNRVT
jgi:hypothetical protein